MKKQLLIIVLSALIPLSSLAVITPFVDESGYEFVAKLNEMVDEINASGGGNLAGMTDTDMTGLSDNDIIRYNLATGKWEPEAQAGGGDMLKSTYDPANVSGDVFDADNHVDGTTNKVFTATEKTKLSGIEASATADQSNAEIKTAYEANANTNEFDDAEQSKLAGIEPAADVTDQANVSTAGAPIISTGAGAPVSTPSKVGDIYVDTTNDNVYSATHTTDSSGWEQIDGGGGSSDHGSLTGLLDDDHTQYSLISSGSGNPSTTPSREGLVYIDTTGDVVWVSAGTASSADWKQVSGAGGGDMSAATYDPNTVSGDVFDMDNMVEGATTKILTDAERAKLSGIESSATVDQTGAEIKTAYESEANTNAFTDAEKTKLGNQSGINTGDQTITESFIIPLGDETTAITTGTAKRTFRMPYAFTVTGVFVDCVTAPTGSVATFDINEGGTSILSTKITIDAGEDDSDTAATAPVISDTSLAARGKMTFDIDGIGVTVAGAGCKATLVGHQ